MSIRAYKKVLIKILVEAYSCCNYKPVLKREYESLGRMKKLHATLEARNKFEYEFIFEKKLVA